MGAGATKQYPADKTRHAEIVYESVRDYEATYPSEFNDDYTYAQSFKKRVLLAAADAKRKGRDVDSSLAQLTDADLETLRKYVEENRRKAREENTKAAADNAVMTVEEFVEEDPNLNDNAQDNIDETTSVLSYGDGEEPNAEVDSEGEIDSSHSLMLGRGSSKSNHGEEDKMGSSGEILEDLDLPHGYNPDNGRNSAVKVFPMSQPPSMATPKRKSSEGKRGQEIEETKEMGIADALAKFWEIDEIGSIASQLSLGLESPRNSTFSPFSPERQHNRSGVHRSLDSVVTKSGQFADRLQKADEKNERLMGLQRQKVMSYTQNAQLEREVEALQRQLERMEDLERGSMGHNERGPHQSPVKLHNSMQSSASTIYSSANNTPQHVSSSLLHPPNSHYPHSKLSYIYPIDEENDWSASMNSPDGKQALSSFARQQQHQQQQHAYYQQPHHGGKSNHKDRKHAASSSSSDEEVLNSVHPQGIVSEKRGGPSNKPAKIITGTTSNRIREEKQVPPAASSSSSLMNNRENKNTNANSTVSPTANALNSNGNGSVMQADGKESSKPMRGGRRSRYRGSYGSSNANNNDSGIDSDDSASNHNNNNGNFSNNKAGYSYMTPTQGSKLSARAGYLGNNSGNNNNSYASDSDTPQQSLQPLSARGNSNKSLTGSNSSGKRLAANNGKANMNSQSSTEVASAGQQQQHMMHHLSPKNHRSLQQDRRARNTIQNDQDSKMSPGDANHAHGGNSNAGGLHETPLPAPSNVSPLPSHHNGSNLRGHHPRNHRERGGAGSATGESEDEDTGNNKNGSGQKDKERHKGRALQRLNKR